MSTPSTAPFSNHAAQHSRFYQRLQRRHGEEMPLLPPGAPTQEDMQRTLDALLQRGHPLAAALRILRQLVLARLIEADCAAQAPLHAVTRAMTALAELALDHACRAARAELDARHGSPCGSTGAPVALWIIGMGKLGARELNVSSDIDLIYVYEEDGETCGTPDGRGRISHHEYFARAVRLIHALVGEATEHGTVFRIDLALRPNGSAGPTALSLPALEEYLQVQGREWERFAWLKSRVVAPRAAIGSEGVQALRAVVLPFVFRRYLDYNVFEALRGLHRQIREHALRRSAGHPERANDVKLSRGGIREIEFIVQLLQVVRGGQFPELRTRPTLAALERVARAGLMPPDTADALARAYVFLRRVEHRIQYLDDQQTHVLPTQDEDLDWIARTLGYEHAGPFLADLCAHRERVAHEFDGLLGGDAPCKGCGKKPAAAPEPHELPTVLAAFPERARERLAQWQEHPRVRALREEALGRLLRLLQRTAAWLDEGRVSEDAVLRLADWVEPLLRRESYLALLLERPAVHERLLRVLGTARWPARYVMRHPGVIDELASPGLLSGRFDAVAFEQELERRRLALASTGEDDDENLLNLLRRAHHAETFRTLVRDIERRITVEQVADDLSALADAILRLTTRWCWPRLRQHHRPEPRFAAIAYGKLGGLELGYGSDLDLVFVFDDEHEDAPDIYAALARKLINWLTAQTREGELYEIDTALRPNGNSGLLVTSFDAYADYQQNRGSNTAWTWEHQAMTRARLLAPRLAEGAPAPGAEAAEPPFDLTARFNAVRHAVLTAPRDHAALRAEIVAMRDRMQAANPVRAGLFDLKHSPGGMVEAEFATQYLVLAHTREHPELEPNLGNIALLQRAETAGLLPAGVGHAAADAYRHLRHLQHLARLDEQSTQIEPEPVAGQRTAIQRLWQAVFE